MKAVRKFLFENDFDAGTEMLTKKAVRAKAETPIDVPITPSPQIPLTPQEPTFSEAELSTAVAEAKAKGAKEGHAKGKADAQAQIEAQIAAALGTIGREVTNMAANLIQDRATILGEASGLALAMVQKMLPELTRRGGLAEITATIERCLIDQHREPRLNIRVPADLLPALQNAMTDLAADKHFEGCANLIGDPSLQNGNCLIEWAGGGLERRSDAIWREISVAFNRCLETQGIKPVEINEMIDIEPTSEIHGDIADDTAPSADQGAENG